MMSASHQAFYTAVRQSIPDERLITDPTRTLAYGTDGSFYRLVPKIVIRAESESEIRKDRKSVV